MQIFRTSLGVIAGYALFVISAVLLFQLSGIDAHANPTTDIKLLTVANGMVFSFAGGFLAHRISGTGSLTANCFPSSIMAGFAAFSLFKTSGNHYKRLTVIFLFAPLHGWVTGSVKKDFHKS